VAEARGRGRTSEHTTDDAPVRGRASPAGRRLPGHARAGLERAEATDRQRTKETPHVSNPGPPPGDYPPPGGPPPGGYPPPGPTPGGYPPPGPQPGYQPGGFPPPGPGYGAPVDVRSGIPLAEPGSRFVAYLIDAGILFVGVIVAMIFMRVSTILGLILYLAVIVAGFLMLLLGEGGPLGQTPGKHLMGIKVVGPQPGPIGYGRAFIRYLGRILDSIICGLPIGYLWIFFDDQRRAWHDMVADTRVVVAPPGEKSLGYWFNHFRG
jgi:uncharacterized RDD family membrane protein YckC